MVSDTTMRFAEGMTDTLLGVDGLLRGDGSEVDHGLVVLNMDPDRVPTNFQTFGDAAVHLLELQRRSVELPEPDRRQYYHQLCSSTLALLNWRQGRLDFAGQIAGFLHVPPHPVTDVELERIQSDMRNLLREMGYDGTLLQAAQNWEQRNTVPVDEIEGTLRALMDEAWDRTVERIEIPAPRSDGMNVVTVSCVAFNARCDYLQRTVELNIDPILTIQALKHLAVHECYPGHYVQFKLRESWYRDGVSPADGLLSIVNSASSSPFEGIADNGMRVIEWMLSDDDRFYALLSRYRSALGTAAAWRLHALGWDEKSVLSWLLDCALCGGEGWAANRVRFIRAPQRAALIWSYWWGEACVQPVWERVPHQHRTQFLQYLYGRMHSPQTAGMFDTPAQ
ncbi:MAG: hypothetical protein NVSMB52_13140 [Chloroflexota bacterium]